MPATLTTKQVKFLRAKAHPLEPCVKLGKRGLSTTVERELATRLDKDELVKVRLGKRVELDLPALAEGLGAVLVQRLGHTAVLYRPAKEPRLKLPD